MADGLNDQVEALFHRATDLTPEHQRVLLDSTCEGNPGLRVAVERLLAEDARLAAGEAGTFLASPLVRARSQRTSSWRARRRCASIATASSCRGWTFRQASR